MPTFDFTAPDGKSYSVDGPDGAAPEQAFKILQDHLGTSSSPSIGVGEDLANVAKTAPQRVVAGLAGIPADLAHLYAPNQSDPNPLGTEALGQKMGVINAQTEPGKLLQKGVDFAPAMIGGPETLATKALTRVVAPAVASEVGGAVGGPVGEVAGALTGAAGATAAARKFQAMAAARNAAVDLTAPEIKAASRAGYQAPDVQDIRINNQRTNDLASTIEQDLQHGPNSGFRPANEGKVFSAIDELRTPANETRPAKIADLDNVRQVLGNAAKEKDPIGQPTRQAVAAQRAIAHIDDFLPNLQQSDLFAGNAANANAILEKARGDWAAYKKSSQVQNLLGNAELNAASANSGGNIQNSIKQAFKPLLKNDAAKVASWTDAEKAQLNKIVRGTWTGSAARAAGNLLGGGGGLGMLIGGAAGYQEAGVPGAVAAGLAGRGFKMIGNRSTFNAVSKLDKMIRAGSPEALKVAAQMPPQAIQQLPAKTTRLLRAMILADPTISQQANNQGSPVGQPAAY